MRSVESVSELQLIMGVLFSIALLCTNIVPVYATQDTLAVAKYVNGEWQLRTRSQFISRHSKLL